MKTHIFSLYAYALIVIVMVLIVGFGAMHNNALADDLAHNNISFNGFADFDAYTNGDLNGQDGWSDGWNSLVVENSLVFQGKNAIKNRDDAGAAGYKELPDSSYVAGVVSAELWIDNNSFSDNQDILGIFKGIGEEYIALFRFANNFNSQENTLLLSTADSSDTREVGHMTQGAWHKISLGWRNSDFNIRVKIDDGAWTEWFDSQTSWTQGEKFGVKITLPPANQYGNFYIDDVRSSLGTDEPAPVVLLDAGLTSTSTASSTITTSPLDSIIVAVTTPETVGVKDDVPEGTTTTTTETENQNLSLSTTTTTTSATLASVATAIATTTVILQNASTSKPEPKAETTEETATTTTTTSISSSTSNSNAIPDE